jgi:hypothetical protein
MVQFLEFDRMYVLVTEEARQTTWPVLKDLSDDRIHPVDIPRGETTAEMWDMFDQILARIAENDAVVFDITHGLRSAPFLVFLFASFLQFARNVTIDAVYYGAYELGDPKKGLPAPVFDLSEFVRLLDWMAATNRFVEGGSSQALVNLLRDKIPPGLQMRDDLEAREIGNHLKSAAGAIQGISQALRADRPVEAMREADHLRRTLEETNAIIAQEARPFQAISQKLLDSYGQFSLADPIEKDNLLSNLNLQLAMIRWYLDHQHVVQAVLLAREWMISALTVKFETGSIVSRADRKEAENVLYQADKLLAKHGDQALSEFDERLRAFPGALEIAKLWQRLIQVRNDIAHCGMRLSAQEAEDLIKKAEGLYPDLEEIAQTVLVSSSPE